MNDKNTINEPVAGSQVILSIDSLRNKHDVFQKELAATHKQFYEILSEVYAIFLNCANDASAISAINSALKSRDIKFKADTSLPLKIVKLVFCSERRRASNYASVLIHAHASGITEDDFAEWVSVNGGIEAIRLRKASPAKAGVTKYSTSQDPVKKQIASMDIKVVIDYLPENTDPGKPFLLLAYISSDGKTNVVGRFDDKAAESRIEHRFFKLSPSESSMSAQDKAENFHPNNQRETTNTHTFSPKDQQHNSQNVNKLAYLIDDAVKSATSNSLA